MINEKYIKVPTKLFMTEENKYQKMTIKAKYLYIYLTNRLNISIKNEWIDKEEKRHYIKLQNKEIIKLLNITEKTAIKIINELI